MIGEDHGAYTGPQLRLYYQGELTDEFLAALCDRLEGWDGVVNCTDATTVNAEIDADGHTELADGFRELDASLIAYQAETGSRDELSLISASTLASSGDGPAWFDLLVGLYHRSVDVGRRPIYTVIAPDRGKYYVPPFTDESILSGEIFQLGWMHVFTPTDVESFGRDRLLSAPATRIEELDDGAIALGLTHGDREEKDAVTAHLGIEVPVGEDWFDDLDHEIDFVRHRAARRIESQARGEEIDPEPILEHLDESDPHVRFKLTRALHHFQNQAVESALHELVIADDSEAVRSMAVDVLGEGEAVREALWDPSPRVQASALDEFWRCPDEEILDRVVELLDSDERSAREKAAEHIVADRFFDDLPATAKQRARRALADRYDHEDSTIRQSAIEAGAMVTPEGYWPHVQAALEDDAIPVQIEAAKRYSAFHRDTEPTIECLLGIVDDGSFYADDAAEALIFLNYRRALTELIPRLPDLDAENQRRITRDLDNLVRERNTTVVLLTLGSIEPVDRENAASVVGEIRNMDRLEELLRTSTEQNLIQQLIDQLRP